jgi:ribonuclease R
MGRKSNNRGQQGKKTGGKVMDSAQLARKILNFLDNNFGQEFNAKQIIKKLEIRDSLTKGAVEPVMHKLAAAGSISKSPRNYFSSVKEPEFIRGRWILSIPDLPISVQKPKQYGRRYSRQRSGFKHALDGDKVRVMVYPTKGNTGRIEGKVLEITKSYGMNLWEG